MPRVLTSNEHWVSATACLLAIAGIEIIGGSTPQSEQQTVAAEPLSGPPKPVKWLWLCAPALVYRLWRLFFGEPFANPWIIYLVGGLAFIGLVGYLVVYSVSYLRATR